MLKFGAALSKVAAEDPVVHKVMVEVQHLLKPGSAYQAPEIAERIKAAMASRTPPSLCFRRHRTSLQIHAAQHRVASNSSENADPASVAKC